MLSKVHTTHARKRQRLSSPDYNLNDDLGDDVLVELDRIETMSQLVRRTEEDAEKSRPSKRMDEEARQRRLLAIEMALTQESGMKPIGKIMPSLKHRRAEEDEHLLEDSNTSNSRPCDASSSSQSASEIALKQVQDDQPQANEDETDWFADSSIMGKGATMLPPAISTARMIDNSGPGAVGFVSANWEVSGKVKAVEISSEALESAASKMKAWAEEIDSGLEEIKRIVSSPAKPVATPVRPALETITNRMSMRTPLSKGIGQDRVKPFKTPSLARSNVVDPRTPERSNGYSTPRQPQAGGSVSTKRTYKSTFKTPFKANMAPGEPGRAVLEREQQSRKALEKVQKSKPQANNRKTVFLLSKYSIITIFQASKKTDRIPLKISGLVPQQFTTAILESHGMYGQILLR